MRRTLREARGRRFGWFVEDLEARRLMAGGATLEAISNVSVPAGKSLILPLRASDTNGYPLTYSFSSTNNAFTVTQHSGNPYLELTVAGYGKMTFQLLKDLAPKTVSIIEGLVNAHYYDGLSFDWAGTTTGPDGNDYTMIEGGNAGHNISATPPFYFDDEFNANAIFTGDGQLATYKSIFATNPPTISRDTNGTGFFITKGAARGLDFTSPIFGQLVRGFNVRDAIQGVTVDNAGKPTSQVTITSARIIEDDQDAVVTISSAAAGTGTITVTINDGHGGTDQKTFTVNSDADTVNDKPILDVSNLQDVALGSGTTATFNLSGQDLEGNPITYLSSVVAGAGTMSSGTAAQKTYTAEAGYVGPVKLFFDAKPSPSATVFDGQNLYVWAGIAPITNVQATAFAALGGQAATASVGSFHDTNPTGAASDFVARIIWGDGTVSDGTISGSGGNYVVNGTHAYTYSGSYPLQVYIGRSSDPGTSVRDMPTMAKAATTQEVGVFTVDAGANSTVNEGAAFSGTGSFAVEGLGGTFTATVDYGDGSGAQPLTLNGDNTFALSHTYADNGTYPVTVTVTNGQNAASDTRSVLVRNVAPTASLGGGAATVRGLAAAITLGATDPSPADMAAGFSYVINWGDSRTNITTATGVSSATHVYAAAGTYTVTVQAKDASGGLSAKVTRKIAVRVAQLQADPFDSAKKALVVGGTAASDAIRIKPAAGGAVNVTVAGRSVGTFKPTGQIIVYGGGGNDSIILDAKLRAAAQLLGGAGNDTLTGGAGNDILIGGAGNDSLTGGAGRDLLIGDAGLDRANGGAGDDVLVAGTTQFDGDASALKALMSEWTRTDETYAVRVGNLTGATQGGSNGTSVLSAATVTSDTSADVLTGSTGADLFLFNSGGTGIKDKATDKAGSETSVDLN